MKRRIDIIADALLSVTLPAEELPKPAQARRPGLKKAHPKPKRRKERAA